MGIASERVVDRTPFLNISAHIAPTSYDHRLSSYEQAMCSHRMREAKIFFVYIFDKLELVDG